MSETISTRFKTSYLFIFNSTEMRMHRCCVYTAKKVLGFFFPLGGNFTVGLGEKFKLLKERGWKNPSGHQKNLSNGAKEVNARLGE